MKVYRVPSPLALQPEDRAIDLVLLQWKTPPPAAVGAAMPQHVVQARTKTLRALLTWLRSDTTLLGVNRPLFVVAPELSLPVSCLPLIDEAMGAVPSQAVFVAGLEFLSAGRYGELLREAHNPDREEWEGEIGAADSVNCACVWLADGDGRVSRFLQPKRNLYELEAHAGVLSSEKALVFTSARRGSSRRLDFCVQICSDFSYDGAVQALRAACFRDHEDIALDLSFVIQMNQDQDAVQIRTAVREYFARPQDTTATREGCLVFVNNASGLLDEDRWGGSQFLFPWTEPWRGGGSPTYRLCDNRAFDHQSVVLRASEPMVYLLTYRPHYLVDRQAGAASVPFVSHNALAHPVYEYLDLGECLQPTISDGQFASIPAAYYWLHVQWLRECAERSTYFREQGASAAMADLFADSYGALQFQFEEVLKGREPLAIGLVELLAPFVLSGETSSAEPEEWGEQAGAAARQFLATLAIMNLGVRGSDLAIRAQPGSTSQAVIGTKCAVAAIWGRGRSARELLVSYAVAWSASHGHLEPYERVILLLLECLDPPDRDRFDALIGSAFSSHTRVGRDDVLAGLPESGAVVRVATTPAFVGQLGSDYMREFLDGCSDGSLSDLAVAIRARVAGAVA